MTGSPLRAKYIQDLRHQLSLVTDQQLQKDGITRQTYEDSLRKTDHSLSKLDRAGVRLLRKTDAPNFPLLLSDGTDHDWSTIKRTENLLEYSKKHQFDPKKASVVSTSIIDARIVVQVRYQGFEDPISFYRSTGLGEKSNVPSDKFYYLVAYDNHERRLVKLPDMLENVREEDHDELMRTHGGIQFLQNFASYLDNQFA